MTGRCAISCAALAAANCAAGYDVAGCESSCEQARLGPCGASFEDAVDCLIEHATVACSRAGAPSYVEPEGLCDYPLAIYADCTGA